MNALAVEELWLGEDGGRPYAAGRSLNEPFVFFDCELLSDDRAPHLAEESVISDLPNHLRELDDAE